MVATPSAVPSRLRFQSDISATVRSSVCMRGSPSDSSSRNAIGSLPSSFAISSMKLSAAKALWPLPTPRQGDSRAPPGLITCSASLFGIGYCGIGEPFITIRSTGAGLAPAIAGRVGHHRFGDHAVVPRDQLAVRVEAGLDVMRGHRPEFAEGDVVLAAPDQLHRLADRLRQPDRVDDHLVLPAAAETAAEDMLMERDLRTLGLQQARDLVEQARRPCVPAQISADLPSALTDAVAFSGSIWA